MQTLTDTQLTRIDSLGVKLAEAAMTALVRLYPAVRSTSTAQLESALDAMRSKVKDVLDEFLDDARAAPTVAHLAFQSAALGLAQVGIQSLKEGGVA